jgi:hypothetical protein
MRLDEQCKVVCKVDSLSQKQSNAFKSKIEDEYRVNMCVLKLFTCPLLHTHKRARARSGISKYIITNIKHPQSPLQKYMSAFHADDS